MLFSSPVFLFLFLPAVIIGYHVLKERWRIYFLLFASLLFYTWGEPWYILIMLLSISINYFFGLLIDFCRNGTVFVRGGVLCAAVLGNLGVLFYYKYLNFAISIINEFTSLALVPQGIVMPIGISFFTFQGMSYVIDLYYANVKVQRNPACIAFYIAFFPQLIAGPIVRYVTIEEQIYKRTESLEKFVEGVQRFILGLSKKAIIANTLGYTADQVFSQSPVANTMASAWVGAVCYAFQIFFDFSGYSDMAIGLGKMFGFDFLENFNYPYISKTITEFWRRWHISLSTWFRDYLYIPLGGNRRGNVYIHLLIVFLATGIWHGASFNFVVWGLWHGFFLIVERFSRCNATSAGGAIVGCLRWLVTMLIVLVGWVFFRVDSLHDAFNYIAVMFGIAQPQNVSFFVGYYLNANTCIMLIIAVVSSLPIAETRFIGVFRRHPAWVYLSMGISLFLLAFSLAFVVSSTYNPFIYFRF